MIVAFDTSVLVPALVAAHPAHRDTLPWLRAAVAGRVEGVLCAHALPETWSVLTRLPLPAPIAPRDALRMVERLAAVLSVVPTDAGLQLAAATRCSAAGLRGGAVHDALHLEAAAVAGCDLILTSNPRDFTRLAAPSDPIVLRPTDRRPP